MPVDERLIKALHVEAMRHPEHEPHVIFQTSTIDALLDGAYDGDVSFEELREHGDLGLGTLDACDGEKIALDGEFFQAAADGGARRVADAERSPFALVVPFRPEVASHQRVFDLRDVDGTIVGFRFPDYAEGIDVPGYHLHFVADDRASGGHVLDCVLREGRAALDPTSELHLELPPGVDLRASGASAERRGLIEEIERDGPM